MAALTFRDSWEGQVLEHRKLRSGASLPVTFTLGALGLKKPCSPTDASTWSIFGRAARVGQARGLSQAPPCGSRGPQGSHHRARLRRALRPGYRKTKVLRLTTFCIPLILRCEFSHFNISEVGSYPTASVCQSLQLFSLEHKVREGECFKQWDRELDKTAVWRPGSVVS